MFRRRGSKCGNRLEKHEQADGVRLLEAVGAKVYVLGTRRKKGDHQGTMQTRRITADAKGYRTPEYKIKKALMKAIHGIDIREL